MARWCQRLPLLGREPGHDKFLIRSGCLFLGSSRRQSCPDLYEVVSNGIHDQIPDGVKVQFPHEIDAVRLDGLGAQVQKTGNFLGAFALRQ